jgi:type II secretory pathway pseudopilin PulG
MHLTKTPLNFMELPSRRGFSLIEVVLAIGIFLVTVLALVGLLGPALKSVDEVEMTDEITSVVNTVNAFLQSSPAIGSSTVPTFDAIFNAVAGDGFATIFVFRSYESADSNDILLKIGFFGETVGHQSAAITTADFNQDGAVLSAGKIYRVLLSPSSVIPSEHLVGDPPTRNANGIYKLTVGLASYPEGYFAMEARIFAENAGASFNPVLTGGLPDLLGREPVFTYNTAIVR